MNILLAPDSFKGSLSAVDFCRICSEQIKRYKKEVNLYQMPLADGGEGTIDAVLASVSGQRINLPVHGPLGQFITAQYAILADGTAVIEMAQASGLPLLLDHEKNPLYSSSYGTGELLKNALEQGCKKIIIGLGGSATNDAGMGMLSALGVKFFDRQAKLLSGNGANLSQINSIELDEFDSRIAQCDIKIAADVTNPLLGKTGATLTYGGQKGADKAMLETLEQGMRHFANKTNALFALPDNDVAKKAGAGAAGGMGFSLMVYAQAQLYSGFEIIAELAKLDELMADANQAPDLIISGEGRFDQQSLQGKLVGRLIQKAADYQCPLLVICGSLSPSLVKKKWSSQVSFVTLVNDDSEEAKAESMTMASEHLKKCIIDLLDQEVI